MGHRDFKTTLTYADDAPNAQEREFVERAFAPTPVAPPPTTSTGPRPGTSWSQ